MAANAFVKDTLQPSQEQEGVALLMLNSDGSLTVHQAVVQGVLPVLVTSVLGGTSSPGPIAATEGHTPESIVEVKALQSDPEVSSARRNSMIDPIPPKSPQRRVDRCKYRLAAKELRHRLRTGEEKYAVQQDIAQRLHMRITDFQAGLNCHNQLREKYKLKHRKGWVRYLMSQFPTMTQKEIAARMRTTKDIVRKVQRQLKREMGEQRNG